MIRLRRLRCSFCRKNAAEVSKLVAGPRVYICDECVAVVNRIMGGDATIEPPPKVETSIFSKVKTRLRRLWTRRVSQRLHAVRVAG